MEVQGEIASVLSIMKQGNRALFLVSWAATSVIFRAVEADIGVVKAAALVRVAARMDIESFGLCW